MERANSNSRTKKIIDRTELRTAVFAPFLRYAASLLPFLLLFLLCVCQWKRQSLSGPLFFPVCCYRSLSCFLSYHAISLYFSLWCLFRLFFLVSPCFSSSLCRVRFVFFCVLKSRANNVVRASMFVTLTVRPLPSPLPSTCSCLVQQRMSCLCFSFLIFAPSLRSFSAFPLSHQICFLVYFRFFSSCLCSFVLLKSFFLFSSWSTFPSSVCVHARRSACVVSLVYFVVVPVLG